jgi:hypothetical protein
VALFKEVMKVVQKGMYWLIYLLTSNGAICNLDTPRGRTHIKLV